MKKLILFALMVWVLPVQAERSPSDLMNVSKTDSSVTFAYCLGYYDSLTRDAQNSDLIRFFDRNSKALGAPMPFSQMVAFTEGQQDGLMREASVQTQLFCTGLVQGTVEAMQPENKTDLPDEPMPVQVGPEPEGQEPDLAYCLGYYATASGRGETFSTLFGDEAQENGTPSLMESPLYAQGVEDANKASNPNLLMQCMDKLTAYLDQIESSQEEQTQSKQNKLEK